MKHRSKIATFLTTCAFCWPAVAAQAGEITLSIEGSPNDIGAARIVLMDSAASYAGEVPVAGIHSVAIRDGKAVWNGRVAPGDYAVIAHHDANANDALDRPLFQLPLEPYGFSQGAATPFGLPEWGAVRFTVTDTPASQNIRIAMNPFATGLLTLKAALPLVGAAVLASLAVVVSRRRRNRTQTQEG